MKTILEYLYNRKGAIRHNINFNKEDLQYGTVAVTNNKSICVFVPSSHYDIVEKNKWFWSGGIVGNNKEGVFIGGYRRGSDKLFSGELFYYTSYFSCNQYDNYLNHTRVHDNDIKYICLDKIPEHVLDNYQMNEPGNNQEFIDMLLSNINSKFISRDGHILDINKILKQ